MSKYFVTCYAQDSQQLQVHTFDTIKEVFVWMQNCVDTNGKFPNRLAIFQSECILDLACLTVEGRGDGL